MKRQHLDEGDDSRLVKARDDRTLDLNATPRGFDLNAPFAEEESQEWISGGNSQEDDPYRDILRHSLEPASDLGIDEELDLLHSVWNAGFQENWQRLDEILESICEEIGKFPSSPPKYQYLTCFYISKKLPQAFSLPKTYKALLSFLDTCTSEASMKKQNFLPAFSCKLLFRAFCEKPEWPLDFVKAYLEDAINLRSWVDNELCKEFVGNVLTAFDEDMTVAMEDQSDVKGDTGQCNVKNRYPGHEVREKAKAEFLKALNHLLKLPLLKENPRLLRMMTLGVKHEEVRVLASSMMEGWLNTPFHFRRAKTLLDRMLHFTNGTTSKDQETVANILLMRLNQGGSQMKNTSNSLYTDIVFQIVQKRPEYSSLALKTFLTAEINSSIPHNVKGISTVLKALPDSLSPERALASVVKELALSDDNLARLQDSITRVLKQLSKDISPFLLCGALLEPWDHPEHSLGQSWFQQVIGLACHFLIQAVAPFATDEKFLLAISSTGKGLKDDSAKDIIPHFKDLSTKIMTFQEEALTWCVDVLSAHLSSEDSQVFTASVQKLMFLQPIEEYHLSASSATLELNSFQLVAFSMHASEEILARVILMGISNQFPMAQEDALHIIEKLVWRAAASEKHIFGTLFADSLQLPAAVMKLASFCMPSVSRQPLPQLVLKSLYWRSCLVVTVIAAFNPSTIGKAVWENIPSVQYLLQYLITENSNSGLSTTNILDDEEATENDIKAEELLESFSLKEQSCTDLMERWKCNVMLQNNQTNRRKPPDYILEELKEIDLSYNLGRTIRSSKDPSFVCLMTSSQDFKEAWKWIQKVAEKQPAVLGMLPYDWQCKVLYYFEFFAADTNITKDFQLNLRKIFSDDKVPKEEATAAMKFLYDKLKSPSSTIRACSRKCISGIMNGVFPNDTDSMDLNAQSAEFTWLEMLEKAKQAAMVWSIIQEALEYESSIDVVWAYLKFLKRHLSPSSLTCVIARFVVSRTVLTTSLLSASAKDVTSGSNIDNKFPVLDLVLDTFNTVCTQSLPWDESFGSMVKLVSRQNDGAVLQREMPNIVLEAMVELVVILGSSSNPLHREAASYGNIIHFLFPVNKNGDMSVAYVVRDAGEELSILSKEQENSLVRTDDIRLVKAGFIKMELLRKIDALMRLRLSIQAKELLLEELKLLSEASVDDLFHSLSAWERSWICGCLPTIKEESPFARKICELRKNDTK